MVNTKVDLCGLTLDNPIIPASGTFGYGYEFAELYDINMLGTFSFKGTTREPRFGNPTPRIAEYAGGLLNAVGLQNPGVDAVIETELPKLKQVFHKPVMANISGFSVAEYAEVCEKLDAQEQVGWLEVNISCPNVHGGGAAFGADPKSAAEVTKAVRAVTKKPIILKLSPTAANIAAVAKACEDEGADGVSLINTLPGMRIDLKRRRPLLANTTGGMSGPGMFPLAVRMVYQVYEAVSIPIVGMGGVTTAEDVIELMLAGATAIGVGAGNGPAYIHHTADVRLAVKRILDSKTFDNGTICASEQSIVVERRMEGAVTAELKAQGAYLLDDEEHRLLSKFILRPNGTMNPAIVGKSVETVAKLAGLTRVPPTARVLVARETGVGPGYPYSNEKLGLILAYYVEDNEEAVLRRCVEILEWEGAGHTFAIHTEDAGTAKRFAAAVPASRVLVNTPAALGGIGATTCLFPALTLGCGAVGGSSSSNNIGPLDLINIKRVAWGVKELEELRGNRPAAGYAPCAVDESLLNELVNRIIGRLSV